MLELAVGGHHGGHDLLVENRQVEGCDVEDGDDGRGLRRGGLDDAFDDFDDRGPDAHVARATEYDGYFLGSRHGGWWVGRWRMCRRVTVKEVTARKTIESFDRRSEGNRGQVFWISHHKPGRALYIYINMSTRTPMRAGTPSRTRDAFHPRSYRTRQMKLTSRFTNNKRDSSFVRTWICLETRPGVIGDVLVKVLIREVQSPEWQLIIDHYRFRCRMRQSAPLMTKHADAGGFNISFLPGLGIWRVKGKLGSSEG